MFGWHLLIAIVAALDADAAGVDAAAAAAGVAPGDAPATDPARHDCQCPP